MLSLQNTEVLNGFESYVIAKGLKSNTVSNLRFCILELLLFLERNNCKVVSEIKEEDVLKYFDFLIHRRSYRSSRILTGTSPDHHLYALRTFFTWLHYSSSIEFNPINSLKFSKSKPIGRTALSKAEISCLFKNCSNSLEKIIVHLHYSCGLRRTEAQHLLYKNVRIELQHIIIEKGKFDKRRVIPIPSKAVIDFIAYIEWRNKIDKSQLNDKSLFLISATGKELTGGLMNKILKQIAKKAKISESSISLHVLRHTIATHLKEAGMPLKSISEFLGHKSLDVTTNYLNQVELTRNSELRNGHWKNRKNV
jgi:integrase/recombinase XerD